MLRNSWPASGLLHVKVFNHVLYYLTGVTINHNVVSAGWVHIHAINKANMPSFLFTIIVPFTCFFLFCSSYVSMDHCFCKLKGAKYVSTSLFRFIQYTLYLTKGYMTKSLSFWATIEILCTQVRTKLCTDPPFAYTGPTEQCKFFKGKQYCILRGCH